MDGVHIGQNDASYEKAREVLGEGKIIGMTVKTRQQAENAIRLGADYVGMGQCFIQALKRCKGYEQGNTFRACGDDEGYSGGCHWRHKL